MSLQCEDWKYFKMAATIKMSDLGLMQRHIPGNTIYMYVHFSHVMSCHCPNRLSLSTGLRGGANASLVSGRGQGTPWIRALTSEQCGVQYLAQGHFDMQLSTAQSWDLNQ